MTKTNINEKYLIISTVVLVMTTIFSFYSMSLESTAQLRRIFEFNIIFHKSFLFVAVCPRILLIMFDEQNKFRRTIESLMYILPLVLIVMGCLSLGVTTYKVMQNDYQMYLIDGALKSFGVVFGCLLLIDFVKDKRDNGGISIVKS